MNERTKAGIPLWEALDRNFRTGSGKRLSSPHITLMLTDGSSTDSLLRKLAVFTPDKINSYSVLLGIVFQYLNLACNKVNFILAGSF